MVSDLLDVSRLTRGKVDLQTEVVTLSSLLNGAVEMTLSELERRGHRVIVGEYDPDIRLRADSARLKQVFSNILHNAARYSPTPGVITIHVHAREREVEIDFQDHGIGIDAELLPRVFDLFAQGKSGLGRQESGLGIGLTVVQRLVSDHGGTIKVFSEGAGQGSRFVVRLPTVDAPLPQLALEVVSLKGGPKHKIMLVDDNRDSVGALSLILDMEGLECREVFTGSDALTLFDSFPARVCVVDIGLPDMSGFDVARALRARQGDGALTLVALSGYATADVKREAGVAGFDYYFAKPLPLGDLLALISGLE
jgi:CheY-like chemotaxis protein/two-component sensor histidine kinase